MPRPESVERVLDEIKKGYAQYSYFFDNLNSAAWIKPLANVGLFKHPPEPERQDNTISYPYWPESRYLARMAAIPAAQDEVVNIVLNIPETTNIRVHLDIVEIALALPSPLAARLLPKTKECFRIARHLLLPLKIGELISHLATGGEADAALTLTKRALQLSPEKEQKEKGEEELFFPKPQTLFQDWDYEQIVSKALPFLSKAAGLKTVRLFCELLNEAIRLSRREPDGSDEDFLYISHELISDSPQFHQAASVLISAVRDSSVLLIEHEIDMFSAVIDELREWKWKSFKRLELYLCRIFLAAGLPRAEEFFSEPEKIEDAGLEREAVLLLKEVFPQLSQPTRQRILEWIDRGPPDAFKQWIRKLDGTTEADVQSSIRRWRRDHFAVLEGHLPDAFAKEYSDLVEASGPANRLEARTNRGGGAYAPPAPKTAEELGAMSIDAVIDFLRSWQPTEGFFEANQEGLSRQLAPFITADPSGYASRSPDFRELDPTYVRTLFEGLTGALKAGTAFDWEQPLELARWVVEQEETIPGRKGDYFVADPDWGWTRNSIVELIREGFIERTGRIPISERGRVWSVLDPLTKDADPELEREQTDHPDHAFLAINSTRGRAINLAIDYAAWVMTSGEETNRKVEKSFDAIPEVQKVLEEHLNIETDPLLAIRSLYGKNFRQLAGLDWKWLESNAEKIFPVNTQEVKYFQAAWESFVVFNEPHLALLRTFRWVYEKAADNLGQIKPCMKSPDSPDDRFGDHLITYYWWGEITLQDALLERFLLNSPESARSHVMWYIAHSTKGWADSAPEEVLERLRKFFEHRLETAETQRNIGRSDTEFQRELSSFGFWFACRKFPEDWSISTLVRVVQLTKTIEPSMTVLQELPTFSEKYPLQCVSVINDLAEGKNEDWLFVGVESETESVFKAALKCGAPSIVQEARYVINQLIARGHSRFRHLLKE